MTRDELAHFMAECEVANYDKASDRRFIRKLSDFVPLEQKAIVDAVRMTLEDLSAAGLVVVPKEPTPEMVKAGLRCGDNGPEPALGVWRDMIDTALEEEPK